MKLTTTLEQVEAPASRCLRDARCTYGSWPGNQPLCALYWHDPSFTFSGGGFMFLTVALQDKKIDFSQQVADFAFSCTGCLACDSNCHIISACEPHAGIADIIRLLRREAVRRRLAPAAVAKMTEKPKRKSDFKLPEVVMDEKAPLVIFVESAPTRAQHDVFKATARLLKKIGASATIYSESGPGGPDLYDYGFWDALEPAVKANWAEMRTLRDRTFVFLNPHGQEFVTRRYGEIIKDFRGIDSRHISQLLEGAFKSGKLKSKKAEALKVSYHDPCYLGRGLGIYDAPRGVLNALDGVELVEMARNREDSFCCGARSLSNYIANLAQDTARERIKDFKATGADLLITACPYCRDNLRRVVPEGEKDRIKDLTEFVNERT